MLNGLRIFIVFWRMAHPLSTFLVICFFLLLVRLLACCLLPALLSFSFLRCLLPVGCGFLTGFCLASYRGVGVGCEAPHLRSVSPKFLDGFCALLISYASASIYGPSGGLVSCYPLSPLLLRRRYSLRGRGIIARSLRAHLSGTFWANNNTYTAWVNE